MKVFVDSNIIILAAKNAGPDGEAALQFLARTDLNFVTSPFVELEVKPKPIRDSATAEATFIEAFLRTCEVVSDMDGMLQVAFAEMTRQNVKVLDALHLAAAHLANADTFVTLEDSRQPMYRTRLVNVERLAV